MPNTYDIKGIATQALGYDPNQSTIDQLTKYVSDFPGAFSDPSAGVVNIQKKARELNPKTPVSMFSTDSAVSQVNRDTEKLNKYSNPSQDPNFRAQAGVKYDVFGNVINPNGGGQDVVYDKQGKPTSKNTAEESKESSNTAVDGTVGTKFSLEEATQLFGTDFTGLHQSADGSFIADSSAMARAGYTGLSDTKADTMQEGVDAIDKQIESKINEFNSYKVDEDPTFQAQAASIRGQYEILRRNMVEANNARQRAFETMGMRYGSSQYAGGVQMGIEGEELKQAGERMSDISIKEASAIADARLAIEKGQYEKLNNSINLLDKLRDNKADTLKEYNNALVEANKKIQAQNTFELEVLKYQLDLKNSKDTTETKEYDLAKSEGFDGNFMDYQAIKKQVETTLPQSYKEWQLAGGEQGTGKSYGQYLEKEKTADKGPTSYQEWSLAGGLAGTGKTYAEFISKQVEGMTDKDRTTFLTITNKYQADSIITNATTANMAKQVAERVEADPSKAGDQISLLYSFIKLLDPTSAVREGELGLAQTTQSYFDKFKTNLEKISQGKSISENAALELARATKELAIQWFETADRREQQYQSQSTTLGVGDAWKNYKAGFENVYQPKTDYKSEMQKGIQSGKFTEQQIQEKIDFWNSKGWKWDDKDLYNTFFGGGENPKNVGADTNSGVKEIKIGDNKVTVAPQVADKLAMADQEFFQATGKHLQVNQSYRTTEQQKQLYAKLSKTGGRVAPPGKSFHEKGMAIDVTNWKEAEKYLRKYGFKNNLADDKGHFSVGEFV